MVDVGNDRVSNFEVLMSGCCKGETDLMFILSGWIDSFESSLIFLDLLGEPEFSLAFTSDISIFAILN